MKTVKKGSYGTEARIIQGLLNLHGGNLKCDGIFGKGSVAELKKFQLKHNLVADGIAGPATQSRLGIIPTANSSIVAIKIPFNAVSKAGVLLRNKERISIAKLAASYDYDFVINGPMFDTKTYEVISDTIVNGKIINGGNFSATGMRFYGNLISQSTTKLSQIQGADFIGGAPTLIENGVKKMDAKGLTNSYLNQKTKWNCTGVDKDSFYFMFSLKKIKLNDMAVEGQAQGLKFLQNNDGGGSLSMVIKNQVILPTDGRAIPCGIGLQVKPF